MKKKIGAAPGDLSPLRSREDVIKHINLKLAMLGQTGFGVDDETKKDDSYFIDLFSGIIEDYKEKSRLLSGKYCPADQRIQDFLDDYLKDVKIDGKEIKLPETSFILDQYGLARELSLPPDKNEYKNEWVSSYRVKQGVLHNPKNDRRTTKGVFHVAEGGLPIPSDKKAVPKEVFAKLLWHAFNPPEELLKVPFTANNKNPAKMFCSVLYKPLVCPAVDGVMEEKRMEIRGFVPGSCVSTIDFGESIFGNEGDPYSTKNDSILDFEHWTGTTGCLVLAPHLVYMKKKDLGLPSYDKATERQRRDGMCWKEPDELYNDGSAFKLVCRDERGIAVTILADNYFGYWKKEVKTHISYSANLFGLAEEEHAGGTLAFPRYNLGETYHAQLYMQDADGKDVTFEDVKQSYGYIMDIFENQNYGVDKKYPNVFYLPENSVFDLDKTKISWTYKGKECELKLLPEQCYILPNGYRVHIEKHPNALIWKMIGTAPNSTFCHKPCTVSGGGKSEISKSLENSIIYGKLYVNDLDKDMKLVEEIIKKDYRKRWKDDPDRTTPSRGILSPNRSLGSVIKLLTPSTRYTDEFNQWLESIPNYIKSLVFTVKRFYIEDWGDDWKSHFNVDIVNGQPGHELNYNGRKIVPSYLRVGFDKDDSWCIYKLRMDFIAAEKIQLEDDISASVTLATDRIPNISSKVKNKSVKLASNCEYRFFQRPDECIVRGFDRQAEADLSGTNVFISNFEPYKKDFAKKLMEDILGFEKYTEPVKDMIRDFAENAKDDEYFIVPSHPRLVKGAPSKNVRYLQIRPDFVNPIKNYLADTATRLYQKIPLGKKINYCVNAVLPGRRNNPPEKQNGIRPLCVYNPLHFQELPELFMDFIASLTGKSPSTTGAGSEGALTKGPFNMLVATTDLNNALLSYILTGYAGYSSAAGYIGPDGRVDHDVSMLIPEIWCRLTEEERDPEYLKKIGCLEKIEDFDYEGKKILASRLGYRINDQFLYGFLGRVFDEPQTVFTAPILQPEKQDLEAFVDGVNNIVEAQKKVATEYISCGADASAIPPLQALLHIMAEGTYNGKDINDPEIRKLFTRDYVVASDWYKERLVRKQNHDALLHKQYIKYLEDFIANPINKQLLDEYRVNEKLTLAKTKLEEIQSDEYIALLEGSIGLDPLFKV